MQSMNEQVTVVVWFLESLICNRKPRRKLMTKMVCETSLLLPITVWTNHIFLLISWIWLLFNFQTKL